MKTYLLEFSNNLLRSLFHPQGEGRWVPGGNAATHSLAVSRGTRFLAYLFGMSRSLCSLLLALKPLVTVFRGFLNMQFGIITALCGFERPTFA